MDEHGCAYAYVVDVEYMRAAAETWPGLKEATDRGLQQLGLRLGFEDGQDVAYTVDIGRPALFCC